MRWHKLFQDLELELERLEREAQLLEASDRIRTEFAQIELADRLRANLGNRIEFLVTGIEPLSGTLAACYPRWSLLKNDDGEALIPHRAIAGVRGLQTATALPPTPTAQRLTLGHALRGLARDRASVQVITRAGQFFGILGQIGRDWAQLQLLAPGEWRLSGEEVTIAHGAICVVQNRN
ncbi:MAG TPA: hypothetical protein VK030_03890 [Actinomycetales bacterium]|nr:hypothetical protein [Actinomycetales bacterium]